MDLDKELEDSKVMKGKKFILSEKKDSFRVICGPEYAD